ncbi:MAG: carboxymuconolactone decarboxylase family protein [Proteobacteria bacterium]|nr:carboxymuconolactone decarboxylase family protein [Pseudomonadota bacterium]
MPRIATVRGDETPALNKMLDQMNDSMGFPANSFRTMAIWPELAEAFGNLAATVNFSGTELPVEIKRLVSHVVSRSSGCQYCAAHTGFQATRSGGVPAEKIEAAFEYETNPMFSEAERAALRVAQGAAAVPNAVTDEDFDELKKHFTDRQIVELVGQISVFGFLNRWNDTMATELESTPIKYAEEHLADSGWEVGKHKATTE